MSRRLLLISPAFHGYWRSIEAAFAARGYEVETVRYDENPTPAARARRFFGTELPAFCGLVPPDRLQRVTSARVWERLREFRPDRVVVIKGDLLDEGFWTRLHGRGTPTLLWLYDDLHRHDYSAAFYRHIGPVVSYSAPDTAALREMGADAHYVPNAFNPALAAPVAQRSGEVVFIGGQVAGRLDMLTRLHRAGIPVHAYGRDWSRHPFDRVRTLSWTRPSFPASRDITLAQAHRTVSAAAAALNIHDRQTGMTMRTFEIPGMAGVQLVDRPEVAEFYDPGTEVVVYESPEHAAELSRRALTDTRWAERIRVAGRARTLAEHTFEHRIAQVDSLWH